MPALNELGEAHMRILALLCGLAVGAYSLPAAFLNGLNMAPGVGGYIIGSAMVGMLGWSWLGGSWGFTLLQSRAWVRGPIVLTTWIVSVVTVLALSAGFVGGHRGEAAAERQAQIERYQRAQANWQRSEAEIRAAEAAGRVKTASARRNELHAAESTLDAGRPASADALAETLAWVTGLDAARVGMAFPVWLAVAMELAGNGAFMAWSFTGPTRTSAPVRKSKSKSKRVRGRSKPAAKVVEPGSDGAVIDLDKKRAQRAIASWAS
jgi:hypothetical protein